MKIFLRFSDTKTVFERLCQLYCYEMTNNAVSNDALYTPPDRWGECVIEIDERPSGFITLSEQRTVDILFLMRGQRTTQLISDALTALFDSDTGRWTVPEEYESCVREYTLGVFEKKGGKLTFDNSTRFSSDGSFTDCYDTDSMVAAFRINAEKHGSCLAKKDFAEAAKYAARLFSIKERAGDSAASIIEKLLYEGGNVSIWAAGYALQRGIMREEALEYLKRTVEEKADFSSSAEVILSEYGGQML